MSTLADRLHRALNERPGGSQADLARYCQTKGPSVSDWFRGETKTLKAQSLVLAAEYLGVRARWLLDGKGPMRHDGHSFDSPAPPAAPPLSTHVAALADHLQQIPRERRSEVAALLGILTHAPDSPTTRAEVLVALEPPPPPYANRVGIDAEGLRYYIGPQVTATPAAQVPAPVDASPAAPTGGNDPAPTAGEAPAPR